MNALIRILFVLFLYCLPIQLFTQIAINTDNADPDDSAMLDIKSTDKGMLIPRMTTSQRTMISSPATGLLVFDNTTASFWFYDGTNWTELVASTSVFEYDAANNLVKPDADVTDMANDDFVFGSPTLDYNGNTGHANRFFFDKSKGAFRAGRDAFNVWDSSLLGNYSFAVGEDTEASGSHAIAMGNGAFAGGNDALALGTIADASGAESVAIGNQAIANGNNSIAIGHNVTTEGQNSVGIGANADSFGDNGISIGQGVCSESYSETALGLWNTVISPLSTTSYNSLDRLLVIGNGTDHLSRSDALVMLKNGNTTLNGALTLNGGTNSYTFPIDDGTNEQILSTDGSGNLSWADDQDNQKIDEFSFAGSTIILSLENDNESVKTLDISDIDTDKQKVDEFSLLGTNLLLSLERDDESVKTLDLSPVITFETTSNVTSNSPGSFATDDFVFGSPSLDDDGNVDHDNRFFFDKSKAAFRVGSTETNFWDSENIGDHSFAGGLDVTANGSYSFAYGSDLIASGDYSFVGGNTSTASGTNAIAFGDMVTSSGNNAVAIGTRMTAPSFSETSFGLFSTNYTPNSATSFDSNDRLFTIGNGTSTSSRSNALVMLKSGNTTLNGDLTINGTISSDNLAFETSSNITSNSPGSYATDDFVFGSPSLDDDGGADHNSRFFFDKSKGAFRAGKVSGTEWNESKIGDFSFAGGKATEANGESAFAFGHNTKATEFAAFAFGNDVTASGEYSFAGGEATTASGYASFVFGEESTASGSNSYALGSQVTASGSNAVAMGRSTNAVSYSETTLGLFSTEYTPISTTSFDSNDRLFTIGNGTSTSSRSDALVMLKSGNTTLNGDLTINGTLFSDNLAFGTTSNITSNSPGTYATDDFVFGSPSLDDDGNADHERRFFFDKDKAAFRAGRSQGDGWDSGNIGNYSFAGGYGSEAKGLYAIAFGYDVIASGEASLAFGEESIASSYASFAGGGGARASGDFSFAFGNENTESSGDFSFAFGDHATASGDNAVAFGERTTATSFSETTIGLFSTEYTPNSPTTFDSNDRLFTIGNGTSTSSRSDALVMLKSGNTTLNGDLTINGTLFSDNLAFGTTSNITSNSPGTYATDDFVFGSPSLDDDGNVDHDRRFFFDKSKGAFRAGRVLNTQWDESNLGNLSGAFGLNTTASGVASFASGEETSATNANAVAFGLNTTASGQESSAFGESTTASGDNSTAFGLLTKAESLNSTAFGTNTTASGDLSTVFGNNTKALSYSEFVIGHYSTDYTPNSTGSIHSTDRLFTIGNGISTGSRSDALVMLKNGNTTLNGLLTLNGGTNAYTFPADDGTNGQFLTTDGSGNLNWAIPTDTDDQTIDVLNLSGTNLEISLEGDMEATKMLDLSLFQNAFKTTANVTSNSVGSYMTDDFVFGSPQLDDNGNADHDNRLFFDKSKGAFRAGEVNDTEWNDVNVGNRSFAVGLNTTASGNSSMAIGSNTSATAFGSLASGVNSNASAPRSAAFGSNNTASGDNAAVFGIENTSPSYSEFVVGMYNESYSPNSTVGYDGSDRIFTIGNGENNANRSNAMVVLKDGKVAIGKDIPSVKLDVEGSVNCTGGTCSSDLRWKKDIQPLQNALSNIQKLRGVSYFWRTESFPDKDFEAEKQIGVIAQEVEKVYPELIKTDKEGYKSMDYMSLTAVLLEAVKEQQTEIEYLKNQLTQQSTANEDLLKRVEKIEALLSATVQN